MAHCQSQLLDQFHLLFPGALGSHPQAKFINVFGDMDVKLHRPANIDSDIAILVIEESFLFGLRKILKN